ncbi:MAG TPA: hypothetical protein VMV07_04655 [Streptosporangiaceae bacterium]|nr:hypothetical protein [Streptosporangiaceae bacterium]
MSRFHRIAILAGAVMSAATLAATIAVPAQAASTPGWRIFYRHHYGLASQYSAYYAVVAPGKGDAWAFGTSNAALRSEPVAARWNGRRWRPASLPAGLTDVIEAASAPSSSDIWAISGLGQYVLHWNGKKWSVAKRWTTSGENELTGVTAFSATNVWVFGGPGFSGGLGTWHYNGHRWTEIGGAASGLEGASALSPRNIWAIGSRLSPGDSVVHDNGKSWTRVSAATLDNAQFGGIVALSRTDVWVVGRAAGGQPAALAVNWNGKRWRKVAVPWKLQLGQVISDGQGGLWMTASSFGLPSVSWVLHRSKSGTWTRTRTASGMSWGPGELAAIPGTHALWGAGIAGTKTGSDGAIFAHGSVG